MKHSTQKSCGKQCQDISGRLMMWKDWNGFVSMRMEEPGFKRTGGVCADDPRNERVTYGTGTETDRGVLLWKEYTKAPAWSH